MNPYTPTPSPLPATLSLPQDVIDDVVVGTVNPQVATLADAIAYQNEKVNGSYLRAYLSATTITNARFPLTSVYTGDGIAVAFPGDVIEFTESGFYLLDFTFFGSFAGSNVALNPSIDLKLVGPNATILRGVGKREDVGDLFVIHATGIIQAGAGDQVTLVPATGYTADAWTVASSQQANVVNVLRLK